MTRSTATKQPATDTAQGTAPREEAVAGMETASLRPMKSRSGIPFAGCHSKGGCDCRTGDECYGDYPPKGVKCRNLEPTAQDFGPDMPDLSDDEIELMEIRCGKD